jgi:RNAse (barnase) inhibitor barstar
MNEEEEQLDFKILRDGAISMYHSSAILNQDLSELERLGYQVIDLNAAKWSKKSYHKDLKEGFGFPDYYGENMDAFNDCLRDLVPIKRIGLVIVFRSFDEFASLKKASSEALLDVIAVQSREWLLSQKRLICLVQSADPGLHFEKIGGISPGWNGQEWFDADRRKK